MVELFINILKYMTKSLNISSLIPAVILAAFLLLSVFAALPASAEEGTKIKDSCTLTKLIKINNAEIAKGTIVGPVGATEPTGVQGRADWGIICLVNTINTVTDWIFFILISLSFVFILIAGFMWMIARDSAEKQKQAGQMIAAALVGIVIAILSRIIPGVVIGILS